MNIENLNILNFNGAGREVSEDLIRFKFPRPEYRVSSRIYRNDESHPPGAARAGLFIVISGKCRCRFGGNDEIQIVLESGQCVNFPEGRYQIEPLNGENAEIVFVWDVLRLFGEIFPDKAGSFS